MLSIVGDLLMFVCIIVAQSAAFVPRSMQKEGGINCLKRGVAFGGGMS
jgi:hypothetical protein